MTARMARRPFRADARRRRKRGTPYFGEAIKLTGRKCRQRRAGKEVSSGSVDVRQDGGAAAAWSQLAMLAETTTCRSRCVEVCRAVHLDGHVGTACWIAFSPSSWARMSRFAAMRPSGTLTGPSQPRDGEHRDSDHPDQVAARQTRRRCRPQR